ncbi:hypothetical protein [Alteribacter keqinensis]|uniref:Uncharacterized protein n=1 Tax=Alteribacter keqinensis TaxID=2483800 RepID=A0A3M7TRB4_9BACI|nr:hypothetical protein [Alteribacter keqinensis]RNA66900.1 hypothetical protein EBO34_17000 [Alteribacter keqinensis]
MRKKSFWGPVFAGVLLGIFVPRILGRFGVPHYGDLLNYLFGETGEAGIWNGLIFPLLFTLMIIGLIILGLNRLKKRSVKDSSE